MTPDRFFSLLIALQSRETVTTTDLAAELGISVRTVFRDVQWLQDAGFPILVRRGRWGGVTLLPGGALDLARLTPAERDHLALSGLDDAQRDQLGGGIDGRRARSKVAPGRGRPENLLPVHAVVTTDNRPWFGPPGTGIGPAELVGDLRRGVRLRVAYRRSDETEATWQVVDPYGLLAKGGRWYLVADRSARPRLYSLERIAGWRALRTPRRLRAGATLPAVAAELSAGWENAGAVRIEGELTAVQLERAKRILGTRLTVLSPEADGRVRIGVACRVVEDVRQLLQFADDFIVTGPPEARERIRELTEAMLRQYR
ncbi:MULTISPECIES: helix-turn-helix transcriptional regulator [Nocardia]|uniref:helix-turn-helix transcriptional regulator n=1 Tax=Nocardia TaxID=1817 RepID=UPI0018931914|nr:MULTISPECIES: WYL domain-containing protein [Nocardia]MBF6351948.1 WYL domain-containing protein [Nocardia flavorosea]